ncbi:MAG: ABC transporter permease subunit [Candidatus Thermoplasmatota archaeon]|nr:ABC transporter permease subunit [Candidatus Thermoplasmatota archaeon]
MADDLGFKRIFRLRIAFQTVKDYSRITIILSVLFIAMALMYAGMYPAFEESLSEIIESGFAEGFEFFRGAEDMGSYIGFLNIELYQIFWLLILGIMIGFVSASVISKEIEGKTIDLLMSNPVSRKQVVFEKFIGLIPMVLTINFLTFLAIIGATVAIDQELNFYNVFLTHLVSIPYFLAIIGIGLLVSVVINEKMKASIIMIALIVGMFIFESLGQMVTDYEFMGIISITHYFDPYDTLKFGEADFVGVVVLLIVAMWAMIIAMIYFEHKDITV